MGFILTPTRLVTIRYVPLKAFDAAAGRLAEHPVAAPLEAFTVLAEEIIDRKADVLEETGAQLERLSQQTFRTLPPKARRRGSAVMRETLTQVGQAGDALSKSRSSLLTLGASSATSSTRTTAAPTPTCAAACNRPRTTSPP